jgi:hypothetical protein
VGLSSTGDHNVGMPVAIQSKFEPGATRHLQISRPFPTALQKVIMRVSRMQQLFRDHAELDILECHSDTRPLSAGSASLISPGLQLPNLVGQALVLRHVLSHKLGVERSCRAVELAAVISLLCLDPMPGCQYLQHLVRTTTSTRSTTSSSRPDLSK